MGKFWTVGKVKGAEVRLHWTLPLGAFFLGGFSFAPWFWLGFVAVVLAHELGHAVLVWRAGHRVDAIDITGFGGACHFELPKGAEDDRGAIAWGGVLAQLFVASIATLVVLAHMPLKSPMALELERAFVHVNLMLVVFNLLPVAPLDGAEAWPWLRSQLRAARKLSFQRQVTLLEGYTPAIEPPAPPSVARPIPVRDTKPRNPKAKPKMKRARRPAPRARTASDPAAYRDDDAFAALLQDIAAQREPVAQGEQA